jgi:hypothetical protein
MITRQNEQQIALETKTNLEIWINDLTQQLELANSRVATLLVNHQLQADIQEMSQWY